MTDHEKDGFDPNVACALMLVGAVLLGIIAAALFFLLR